MTRWRGTRPGGEEHPTRHARTFFFLRMVPYGATHRCTSHGGGRRCQEPSCEKGAMGGSGKCISHGGGRRCGESGAFPSTVSALKSPVSLLLLHALPQSPSFHDYPRAHPIFRVHQERAGHLRQVHGARRRAALRRGRLRQGCHRREWKMHRARRRAAVHRTKLRQKRAGVMYLQLQLLGGCGVVAVKKTYGPFSNQRRKLCEFPPRDFDAV